MKIKEIKKKQKEFERTLREKEKKLEEYIEEKKIEDQELKQK